MKQRLAGLLLDVAIYTMIGFALRCIRVSANSPSNIMNIREQLRSAKTLHDVALLLGYKPNALSYILYKKSTQQKYTQFEIPKKDGTARIIDAPTPELKLLQKKLSSLLHACLCDIRTTTNQVNKVSHGFEKERSIITNAKRHKNKRYLFNVDIENFFGSINFGRVRGFFIKDKNFLLNEKVATIIAQIACFDGKLPQGSPCSPIISNLIGHIVDVKLIKLASKYGCTYSRYADDLSFSTNKKEFPKSLAYLNHDSQHEWSMGSELEQAIKASGFNLNTSKTRMQYRNTRQEVTGLIVNQKINVCSEYKRSVRAMVHQLCMKGEFKIRNETGKINQLHGMLNFIHHIQNQTHSAPKTGTKVFKQFLTYKYFYAHSKPVILCEGKTDYIYLKHALQRLSANNSDLIKQNTNTSFEWKISFFKYPETSTGKILELKGGTGDLCRFIKSYDGQFKKFGMGFPANPLILIIDNDDGAKSILNTIKEVSKEYKNEHMNSMKTKEFIHVMRNFYVIPTPLNQTQDTKIEDFFEPILLATKLKGKSLSCDNQFDKNLHYGKTAFARSVIEKNYHTISFSNFQPLLDRVVSAINHYNSLKVTAHNS